MPFTPFHVGPAVLLWAVVGRRLDLPVLLAGSVILDVRAALVVFGPLGPPVHGPLTTFLGATAVGLLLALGAVASYPLVQPILARRDVAWSWSPGTVVAGALAGTWSHVLLDALLYADVAPFAPLAGNPFLGLVSLPLVYGACLASFALAVVLIAWRRVR